MKVPLLLAPVFVVSVVTMVMSGCFLGFGGRDAGLGADNQQQNTARAEVLTEYDAAG